MLILSTHSQQRRPDAMSSHMIALFPQSNPLRRNLLKKNPLKNRAALGVLALLLPVFLSVLLWGLPGVALAQKDGAQEIQVQAGAYLITVIADPSRLSLGTVLYTITVVNSETDQRVSDARVIINTRHKVEDIAGWATALNQASNPGVYEATVQLDSAGIWHTSVEVSSSLGRVEVEVPPLTIPKPRQTRVGSVIFLGIFLAILLGVAYQVRSSRKAIKARETARESARETSRETSNEN